MNTLSKPCMKCKAVKPFSEFYIRSGIKVPTEPGHYNSECKFCIKERRRKAVPMPRGISRVETENLAIRYLATCGIPALPGKANMMPDTDIVALGVVGIEVKLGTWSHQGRREICSFSTTPKQQQRGFLAHLVMMIVPRDFAFTFHIMDAAHPAFFKDGHVKSSWGYVEDRYESLKFGSYYTVLTEDVMQEARDNTALVLQKAQEISEALRSGKTLAELLPCVSQPNWDLVGGVIPELYG